MRRIFSVISFLVAFGLTSAAWAAGSLTFTDNKSANESEIIYTLTWVASASDGTFTTTDHNTTTNQILKIKGYVFMVVTDPGTTAPTNLYDIQLLDEYGFDIMGGTLADRSTSATQTAIPLIITGVYGERYVNGNISVAIANNSVNSATGRIIIYTAR